MPSARPLLPQCLHQFSLSLRPPPPNTLLRPPLAAAEWAPLPVLNVNKLAIKVSACKDGDAASSIASGGLNVGSDSPLLAWTTKKRGNSTMKVTLRRGLRLQIATSDDAWDSMPSVCTITVCKALAAKSRLPTSAIRKCLLAAGVEAKCGVDYSARVAAIGDKRRARVGKKSVLQTGLGPRLSALGWTAAGPRAAPLSDRARVKAPAAFSWEACLHGRTPFAHSAPAPYSITCDNIVTRSMRYPTPAPERSVAPTPFLFSRACVYSSGCTRLQGRAE